MGRGSWALREQGETEGGHDGLQGERPEATYRSQQGATGIRSPKKISPEQGGSQQISHPKHRSDRCRRGSFHHRWSALSPSQPGWQRSQAWLSIL